MCGNRPVVELGCGDGYFTFCLRQKGVKALGIDPYKDGEYLDHTSFLRMKAAQCSIATDRPCLLIAARPDHSGWVTNIPFRMHEDSELLYIGKPRNVDNDLYELLYEEVDTPELEGHITLSLHKHEGDPPNCDLFAMLEKY